MPEVDIGETADIDLTDDAGGMAKSGEASPPASGFVIFKGPRERSSMTAVESSKFFEEPPGAAPFSDSPLQGKELFASCGRGLGACGGRATFS